MELLHEAGEKATEQLFLTQVAKRKFSNWFLLSNNAPANSVTKMGKIRSPIGVCMCVCLSVNEKQCKVLWVQIYIEKCRTFNIHCCLLNFLDLPPHSPQRPFGISGLTCTLMSCGLRKHNPDSN